MILVRDLEIEEFRLFLEADEYGPYEAADFIKLLRRPRLHVGRRSRRAEPRIRSGRFGDDIEVIPTDDAGALDMHMDLVAELFVPLVGPLTMRRRYETPHGQVDVVSRIWGVVGSSTWGCFVDEKFDAEAVFDSALWRLQLAATDGLEFVHQVMTSHDSRIISAVHRLRLPRTSSIEADCQSLVEQFATFWHQNMGESA